MTIDHGHRHRDRYGQRKMPKRRPCPSCYDTGVIYVPLANGQLIEQACGRCVR